MRLLAILLAVIIFQFVLSCNKPNPTKSSNVYTSSTKPTTQEQTASSTIVNGCLGVRSDSILTENGSPCIFPFFDGGKEFTTCADWKGKYFWCATSLRSNCRYLKWEKCMQQDQGQSETEGAEETGQVVGNGHTGGEGGKAEGGEEEEKVEGTQSGFEDITVPEEEMVILSCTSEKSSKCSIVGGYCMEKSQCPRGEYSHNRCPGGDNIKCCKSVPYQETECATEGGVCADACGCIGEALVGKCPSQPAAVKCCVEEEVEIVDDCGEEPSNEVNECLNQRMKRFADCSSETSKACAAEGGFCVNPASCPANKVVHNKCPGGNDNKCCLSIPYQEAECEGQGGECGDRCGCKGDVLHGFCPTQPDSIKCCKSVETIESAIDNCMTETPNPLNCPGGTNTNCNNGNCTVTCSGGLGSSGTGGGENGGGENGGGENGGGENGGGENGGGDGSGEDGAGGQNGGMNCPNGYSSNCNNGKCQVTCSGGSSGNTNNNNNINARKKRRIKRQTGAMCPMPGNGEELVPVAGTGESLQNCQITDCAEKLALKAESMLDSKKWALEVSKTPSDPRLKEFDGTMWKCNLFVADMIFLAKFVPPANDPSYWGLFSKKQWPYAAIQWTKDVSGWKKATKICRGDVVSTGKHMGIAISETTVMAAGRFTVHSGVKHGLTKNVIIQRMDCPIPLK